MTLCYGPLHTKPEKLPHKIRKLSLTLSFTFSLFGLAEGPSMIDGKFYSSCCQAQLSSARDCSTQIGMSRAELSRCELLEAASSSNSQPPPQIFLPSRTVTPHDDSLGSDGPRFSVHLDRRAAPSRTPQSRLRTTSRQCPPARSQRPICPEHGTEKCRAHPLAFVVLWTLHYLLTKR